jgi:hypothetical protein
MAAHLTAPFAAGAAETTVPMVAGRADVAWSAREPIVLVSLKLSLTTDSLIVNATVDPDHTAKAVPGLYFAPYSEAGASLVLFRPPIVAATRLTVPFSIVLSASRADPGGRSAAYTPIADNQVATWLECRVVEGILGRLIYALGSEKQRLRGRARELQAMRLLALARDNALDRMGADVAVPRFGDAISYDAGKKEIITLTRREPDAEYRRRLAPYRRALMPNKRRITQLLNGPGSPADPNAGALHDILSTFTSRFTVTDASNPLALAILLVASKTDQNRLNFLDYVRNVHLIWPANDAQANAVHTARFLPGRQATSQDQLRIALRTRFVFQNDAAANPALAPMLGDSLVRAADCREALGLPRPWSVTRLQKSDGGSRYELGLGANLALTTADLDQLATAWNRLNRPPAADPRVEALLTSMSARSSADDPAGRWLFEPCGLRTAYRIDPNTVYVSHLPVFGLVITGPSLAGIQLPAAYQARFRAAEDRATNAVLDQGLSDAARAWAARGGEAWTLLSLVDGQALWDKAVRNDSAGAVFSQAGLPAMADPKPAVESLKKLPPELIATIRLGPTLTHNIFTAGGANELATLLSILADANISAALALATSSNEVVLVVAVTGLPVVGVNLQDQRSAVFRWYAVSVGSAGGGPVTPVGSAATFTPLGPGLTALIVVAYARRGLADPYGFRVDLPAGALLNLPQYEFLMNLLERAYPAGIEVNTFAIRTRHVDLDGDGTADPLPPTISRTYRLFQRRRLRGETAVPVGGG